MNIRKATIQLNKGDKGNYAGFPITVKGHYDGNMYEIYVPGGLTCVSAEHITITAKAK